MSLTTTNDSITKWDQEKLELIRRLYCKGATDDEMEHFAHICQKSKLDPLLKQIYFMKYSGKMTTITSIDGYRLIADRTGKYSPGKETTFAYDKNGFLVSATACIRKMTTDGTWHDVSATAHLVEYKPKHSSQFWAEKPHIMLGKCAEALALRKAFPADLSGMYVQEEMDQAKPDNEETKEEVVVQGEQSIPGTNPLAFMDNLKIYELADELSVRSELDHNELLVYLRAAEKKCIEEMQKPFEPVYNFWLENPNKLVESYHRWHEKAKVA